MERPPNRCASSPLRPSCGSFPIVSLMASEGSAEQQPMEHSPSSWTRLERPSRPDELDEKCAAMVAEWLGEAADLLYSSAIVAHEVEWSSDIQASLSDACDSVSQVVDELPSTSANRRSAYGTR